MILYKYVSFESGFKILCNGTIGFTHLNDFNDPFESTAFGFVDRESTGKKHNQTLRFKEYFSDRYAVLSLTKDPLNALMWAHYGDSHKGMVVGFDVDEAGFNRDDFIINALNGEMKYPEAEQGNDYCPTDEDIENIGNDEYYSLYSPKEDLFRRAFLNKQVCWMYEEEVRIVKNLYASDLLRDYEQDEIRKDSKSDQNWSHVMNGYNSLYLFHLPKSAIKEVFLGKNAKRFSDQDYDFLESNKQKKGELYYSHICDHNFQTHIRNTNCKDCQKLYECPPLAYRLKCSDLEQLCEKIGVVLQIVDIDYSSWKLKARSSA